MRPTETDEREAGLFAARRPTKRKDGLGGGLRTCASCNGQRGKGVRGAPWDAFMLAQFVGPLCNQCVDDWFAIFERAGREEPE